MNDQTPPTGMSALDFYMGELRHAVATGDGDLFEIAASVLTAYDAEDDAVAETVRDLADTWRTVGTDDTRHVCAIEMEVALGVVDTASSASRQHYIDTGRYMRPGEES